MPNNEVETEPSWKVVILYTLTYVLITFLVCWIVLHTINTESLAKEKEMCKQLSTKN
jgi:hypothetical protein